MKSRKIHSLIAFAFVQALLCPVQAQEVTASAEDLEFFEKKVRPLLAEHCYECHSQDSERIEGGLYLDSRAAHIRGGDSGAAIVPGESEESLLIEAVRYESYEMPPSGKLPQKDIETLARWVAMGAPWPEESAPEPKSGRTQFDLQKRKAEFWLWQPIEQVDPPKTAASAWPLNDIDRFILSKLEEASLTPTSDCDSTALLRRLYFDLIGLPPSPAEVKEFLRDCASPNDRVGTGVDAEPKIESARYQAAIERVVDRLLASRHFGERWARHWLDLVRYAESRGHEFDNDTPNAFQYRDYLIRALNADVPYDQFVREHIAGDLLETPRLHPTEKFNESVLGTGFWYLGEWVHSPVDIRKDESDRFDNMLDVMSKTFLGVTVACARCHDHKFDAISTADYYSLSGFLQSSDYRQVRFESIEQNRQVAKELSNVDSRYQSELIELLRSQGIEAPKQASYIDDPSIVVDYANVAQNEYLQDGVIFGHSPNREGVPYLDSETSSVQIATYGSAHSDSFWKGLESKTEGTVQNKSAISKLPKSGRTLRSPTFLLREGKVSSLVKGAGHIIACVDSHRLVAGPLHKQTIRKVSPGDRWVTMDLSRYVGHRLHLEFVPAKNQQLEVRMVTQGLNSNALEELDQRLAGQEKQYAEFASKADSILNAGFEIEETVFADFESGTYEGWESTGDAFGNIPQTLSTIASYQGKINRRGDYFVNSHNIRPGGDVRKGDSLTGTLTSSEFQIDFDTIEFLVGGGPHQGKTCVNLVVDGKTVRTATGKSNNQMYLNTWDVQQFSGKNAKIEIVDNYQGGWGNIGVDHIVFKKITSGLKSSPPNTKEQDAHRRTDGQHKAGNDSALIASTTANMIIRSWQKERKELSKRIVHKSRLAPAMLDGIGEDDHILIRGNSSKPGELEPRHFLTALSTDAPMQIRSGSGRLELADHINDPKNPLTSRVIVNRVWHHLMGRGIVPTVDDFGFLGQRPSHPELLDHLATKFLADGQSIKQLIKYIVLSRTYQLSSLANPAALEVDPKNTLWHHQPPRRLQGEAIRDSLLSISGQIDTTPFGPPVPIHLTSFMDGRGRPAKSGPLDGNGRRSIYIAVRRNFLSPFMLAFDTPVPFSSMGRRNVSNVPAQALILLNDPLVRQLASNWGQRALTKASGKAPSALKSRIDWMYLSGFGRYPTKRETSTAVSFLEKKAKAEGVETDNSQLWEDYAHVLVNTKEFIFLR